MESVKHHKIFISYKWANREKVEEIKKYIEKKVNETCWFDRKEIEPSNSFEMKIIDAISNCKIVLFMYSKEHACIKADDEEFDYTIRELLMAREKRKNAMLVKIDGTELTDYFIWRFGHAKYTDANDPDSLNQLCKRIRDLLDQHVESVETTKQSNNILKQCAMNASTKIQMELEWIRHGAEQGYSTAQNTLGDCFFNGNQVPHNYAEAVRWYTKAANKGNSLAQCSLGVCYKYGLGVEYDLEKAREWLQKSAIQGNAEAQSELFDINDHYCSNKE